VLVTWNNEAKRNLSYGESRKVFMGGPIFFPEEKKKNRKRYIFGRKIRQKYSFYAPLWGGAAIPRLNRGVLLPATVYRTSSKL